ncbi:DUF7519 family protein [Halosegnis marinus]|uniref:Uncharacterized protein n=1 Tax=Halosegnis marinus TaxID=3034023 RepID=A0ABD5ZMD7_9EURY|nr:hypothetical protein [Halosegnis sp. DT85]
MSDDASGARAGPRSGDTETEPAGFEAGVPDLARAATLSAALVAAAALAVVPVAAAVGFLGAVLVAVALSRRSGTLLDAGVGALVVGVLVAGAAGASVEPLLVATAAALVAYDTGETGLSVAEQLGLGARTGRLVAARAATSVGVLALATGAAYAVYRFSAGAPSTAAVTLLLVGAFLVAAALR